MKIEKKLFYSSQKEQQKCCRLCINGWISKVNVKL